MLCARAHSRARPSLSSRAPDARPSARKCRVRKCRMLRESSPRPSAGRKNAARVTDLGPDVPGLELLRLQMKSIDEKIEEFMRPLVVRPSSSQPNVGDCDSFMVISTTPPVRPAARERCTEHSPPHHLTYLTSSRPHLLASTSPRLLTTSPTYLFTSSPPCLPTYRTTLLSHHLATSPPHLPHHLTTSQPHPPHLLTSSSTSPPH